MNDASGTESRRLRASSPIKSYWLRCALLAITMMLRRLEQRCSSGGFFLRELLDGGETTPPLSVLAKDLGKGGSGSAYPR